jgi:nucleotide-binding universal stress UspA family protein
MNLVDRSRYRAHADAIVGTPAEAIIEFASATGTSLIVMGTHGRTGLAHLLMGSVAEQVVRTAPCPVLTVRQAAVADEAVAHVAMDAVEMRTPVAVAV